MKPLAPNTILQSRYEISKIIGKGGMGEVYLAVDSRLGNKVALKRTTVGDDQMLADAFENEARTLAGLRHPVLPKVSDHFLENEEQFLVMDFIEGHDLSKRLKETNKPFPVDWVMFWADQILEALTYLHTNDPPIIHRDIKPQNLKLTGDNQVVLLDFGLSKNSLGQTRVTTSGSVVGYTPHYAPMEQIRGTGTNAKSDIYALSATLYQLLTNTVPPDALTRADALLANLPDPLKPLHDINNEVSVGVSDTIMKGLDVSQDKRFESAREMQKLLRRSYNKMKQGMAAETVAFGVGQVEATDISGEKTEVFDGATVASDVETVTPPERPDYESMEPVGEKTEVLLAQGVTSAESAPSDAPTGFETEDYSTNSDVADEVAQFDAVQESTEPGIEIEDVSDSVEEEIFADEPEDIEEQPVAAAATAAGATSTPSKPRAKSSTGKYVGILAGLAFLLLVVAGTVGGGLWYWSQMGGGGTVDAGGDPTPEVNESVEPTPESTLESTLPVNTTEDSNANTESNIDQNEDVNTDPGTTSTPTRQSVSTPTSRTPRSTPVTRRTPVKKRTPRPTPKKTVPKKTPKKTPKKKKDAGVL